MRQRFIQAVNRSEAKNAKWQVCKIARVLHVISWWQTVCKIAQLSKVPWTEGVRIWCFSSFICLSFNLCIILTGLTRTAAKPRVIALQNMSMASSLGSYWRWWSMTRAPTTWRTPLRRVYPGLAANTSGVSAFGRLLKHNFKMKSINLCNRTCHFARCVTGSWFI